MSSDSIWSILSHPGLLFALFILLTLPMGAVSLLTRSGITKQKKAAQALKDYVTARGFRFLNPKLYEIILKPNTTMLGVLKETRSVDIVRETDGLSGIREFRLPSNGMGFFLEFHAKPLVIFQHASGGKNAIFFRVAKLTWEGLPEFRLQREDLAEKVLEFAGVEPKIGYPSRPAFSKMYHLSGSNAPAVKAFFPEQKAAYLERHPMDGRIVSTGKYLVYFEIGNFPDAPSHDVFIIKTKSFFDNLLS